MTIQVRVCTTSHKLQDCCDTISSTTSAEASADTLVEASLIPEVMKGIAAGQAIAHARYYTAKDIADQLIEGTGGGFLSVAARKALPG